MNTSKGFEAVVQHFEQNNWRFQREGNPPRLHATFGGKHGAYRCVATVDETDHLFRFFAFLPGTVPAQRIPAVSDLCARASRGMKLGRFELDAETSQVRFQTSAVYPEGELSPQMIRRVVLVNLATIDFHSPAFMRLIGSDSSPTQAFEQINTALLGPNHAAKSPALPATAGLGLN